MLPSSPSEFRSLPFWRSFFAKRGGKPFEWYSNLADILPDFALAVPLTSSMPPPRLLIPGCGNSDLSEELSRAGYTDIISCDFDEGVIQEMRTKTATTYPGLKWETANATDLDEARFATGGFAGILDKGLLDALLPHGDDALDKGLIDAHSYLTHSARILTLGTGFLAIVTLAQTHVLELLLSDAASTGAWTSVSILATRNNSQSKDEDGGANIDANAIANSPLCPFLILLKRSNNSISFTTTTPAATVYPPLDVTIRGLNTSVAETRVTLKSSSKSNTNNSDLNTILSTVADIQWSFTLQRSLSMITGQTYVALDLWIGDNGMLIAAPRGTCASALGRGEAETPAYSVVILDTAATTTAATSSVSLRAAVLLVPAGREHEWAFGAPEGQRDLAESARVDRLIVVTLGTGAVQVARFHSMTPADVQAELSPIVLTMVPKIVATTGNIPFLSVAVDLGHRIIVAEGDTHISGRYFVEDFNDTNHHDGENGTAAAAAVVVVRRLIFNSNRAALQTEMCLNASGLPNVTAKLSFDYHRAMARTAETVGAELFATTKNNTGQVNVLVIGLGGGALPSYLAASVATKAWGCAITAVELDEGIVDVAEQFFAFPAVPTAARIRLLKHSSEMVTVNDEKDSLEAETFGKALLLSHATPTSSSSPAAVNVVIGDGLRVIHLLAHTACPIAARPSIIIIDVNAGASDLLSGLSFPPPAFVTPSFLSEIRSSLSPGGILILNLGARSVSRRKEAIHTIANAFPKGHTAVLLPREGDDTEDEEESELNCLIIAGDAVANSLILSKIGAKIVVVEM